MEHCMLVCGPPLDTGLLRNSFRDDVVANATTSCALVRQSLPRLPIKETVRSMVFDVAYVAYALSRVCFL